MNKALIAAAFALTTAGGAGLISPASASPAWPGSSGAIGAGGQAIVTVAAAVTQPHQQLTSPAEQQPSAQSYPVYHDSPTASYFAKPVPSMPCHFTEAFVEGRMRQVEVCD